MIGSDKLPSICSGAHQTGDLATELLFMRTAIATDCILDEFQGSVNPSYYLRPVIWFSGNNVQEAALCHQ